MDAHHLAPPELSRLAESSREIFESILAESLGHQRTPGTCLYATVLCAEVINRFTIFKATVRGGDGESDGGLYIERVGHGHYWVEATAGEQAFVVDVTADQFGLPKVIVAPFADLPARYIPGDQEAVDGHAAELMLEIQSELAGK
ncbi:hypothetical protein QO021_28505 (plasmid) [Pseudomonas amygdali pv. lachrymans]|uniref:hypothetical protein n=1 Tax=Pseudomonas amygdali TaxID=47877 RepID=UPI0006B8873C|nr:hypothetical protein [Pseudomonas amygdali]RMM39294.1 hypothetical protein ALQ79_200690 [Pseudomonas amygdali pv. lachrymans]WIO61501.1 hypothetical protein QO021_28505 [Pseudomonas amygdali pv. lachrymans]